MFEKEVDYLQLGEGQNVVAASKVGYIECCKPCEPGQPAPLLKVPCMLLEFSPYGTLADYILKVHSNRQDQLPVGFDQGQTKLIVKQVADGLLQLHSKCLVHRDIKAGV